MLESESESGDDEPAASGDDHDQPAVEWVRASPLPAYAAIAICLLPPRFADATACCQCFCLPLLPLWPALLHWLTQFTLRSASGASWLHPVGHMFADEAVAIGTLLSLT